MAVVLTAELHVTYAMSTIKHMQSHKLRKVLNLIEKKTIVDKISTR